MKSIRLPAYVSGVAAAVLLALLFACLLKSIEQQRRSDAREVAQAFSLRLVERLSEAAGAVYMLTAAVDRQSGQVNRFDELAEELIGNFPLLRALELAPGGVIRNAYPLRGNEVIIGHDLLVDKTRNREVHLAISRRQMAIAGPLSLRQGGLGVLARYPLYQVGVDGRPHFWGLSIGVIDFPSLLLHAGDAEFERLGYRYEICWVPLGESECKNAKGEPVSVDDKAVRQKIGLSNADWRLVVTRRDGWLSSLEIISALLMVLVPAILIGRWVGHALDARNETERRTADGGIIGAGPIG
jgi:sensor domain CHASE-containing protein